MLRHFLVFTTTTVFCFVILSVINAQDGLKQDFAFYILDRFGIIPGSVSMNVEEKSSDKALYKSARTLLKENLLEERKQLLSKLSAGKKEIVIELSGYLKRAPKVLVYRVSETRKGLKIIIVGYMPLNMERKFLKAGMKLRAFGKKLREEDGRQEIFGSAKEDVKQFAEPEFRGELLEDSKTWYYYVLGEASLSALGASDTTKGLINKSLDNNPENPYTWWLMFRFYSRLAYKARSEALELEVDGDRDRADVLLAEAQGHFLRAKAAIDQAVTFQPKRTDWRVEKFFLTCLLFGHDIALLNRELAELNKGTLSPVDRQFVQKIKEMLEFVYWDR